MSESKFHRNYEQHINFSENLTGDLKKTGQDVLNQISNLDPKTSNQLLLKLINRIVGDIFNIIRDLQDVVIKCNPEEQSTANLKEVVKKLTQYCNEIIQEYDSSSGTVNEKLLVFVKNIILEAEGLLNIIKNDDLHDFKHELVESLKEVLYTINITQARMQLQNYTEQQLNDAVKAMQKEHFDNVAQIEKCSLEVLKIVAQHLKHTIKHCLQVAYYLNKVASNYEDSAIQHKILESANLLNIASTTMLFDGEKSSNTQEAIATLKSGTVNCWNAVMGLLQFIDNSHGNKKTAENLKDVTLYVVSYGLVINNQLGKDVKNNGSFA